MEQLQQITLVLHGLMGAACLVTGAIAILSKKAGGRHPKAGRVFAVCLVLAYLVILPNIVLQRNVFMLGIGWLAAYAGIDGWRALRRFKGELTVSPQPLDHVMMGLCFLLALALAVFGLRVFLSSGNLLGLVCVGFAALGASLGRASLQRFRETPPRSRWLAAHIGLMSGAFAAALTAFFAVQLSGRIGSWEWVVWVAPTVLMMRWARREEERRGLVESPAR